MKLRPLLLYLISSILILGCEPNGEIFVDHGVDSEFKGVLFYFGIDGDDPFVAIKEDFGTGRTSLSYVTDNWRRKDDFLENLSNVGVLPYDSVAFFDEDSLQKLQFINPMVDDSVDFKAKKSAHFWNIDNWYATKDAVFYLLTAENFERFAEEI